VTVVERDEVAVMFRSAADEQAAITRAWSDLEGAAFQELARRPDRDDTRLGIEFYRSRDVVDLLQPVP